MRILFVGDIVGEPGRKILRAGLPVLKAAYDVDVVIVNAENVSGGSGMTVRSYQQLSELDIDAYTMGDHVYRKKEIFSLFNSGQPICKPANFPRESPGPDHVIIEPEGRGPVAVFCLLGRVFMKPVDCPFHAADRILESLDESCKVVIVDVHAEATSDKQLLGRHLAGRVSAVLGTHTHVPTADAQLLPEATAFISDVGMTGPYDGIIGRRYDRVHHTTTTFEPMPFDVAKGDPRISGALIDVDQETGRARHIELVHVNREQIDKLKERQTTQTVKS